MIIIIINDSIIKIKNIEKNVWKKKYYYKFIIQLEIKWNSWISLLKLKIEKKN